MSTENISFLPWTTEMSSLSLCPKRQSEVRALAT